jgi:hypothetical protein
MDEVILNEANEVLVHPNPSDGLVQLRASHVGIVSIEVLDLSGRTLHQEIYPNNENRNIQIDLTAFSNGVYIVKTRSGDRVYTHRLVVAH